MSSITDRRSVNSLDDCDEADEKERRLLSLADPHEIMKTPVLRKSKYYQFPISQQLWLLLSIDGSVERKLIFSFIFGFYISEIYP